MKFKGLFITIAGVASLHAGAAEKCEILLAKFLLAPPATMREQDDDVSYTSVSRYRFLERVSLLRPMSSTSRGPRAGRPPELIFHLGLVGRTADQIWTRTNLVVRMAENEVRFDHYTGEVGAGSRRGFTIQVLGVRIRFELQSSFIQPPYLMILHDQIIPEIEVEIESLNAEAEQRFRRRLMSKLEQGYPGEYEAELAADLTAEELGFLIEALGKMP